MNNNNYIIVQGWMINELKLKGNKLLLYALIYWFSQDGTSTCKASISYVMKALGISKNTAITLAKELIEEKLIEEVGTNQNEYRVVVQKLNYTSAEIELVASAKTEHNNNIYNNINNNINKKEIKEKIYSHYISKFKTDVRYRYKSKVMLYLDDLLKEYDDKELLSSIDNYYDSIKKELKFALSPKNFFSNSKKNDKYRVFEDYLKIEKSVINFDVWF